MISPPLKTFIEPGPGNGTRWIHTVVRMRHLAGLEGAYYAIVASETLLLLLSLLLVPVYACHIWKRKPVHNNLIFIALQQLAAYEVAIIARLVIILYETGLVSNEGFGYEPVPSLNIIRVVHYTHVLFFNIVVFVERFLATRYVSDYESKKRLKIPIAISSLLLALSIGAGFRVVYAQSNAYFWTGVSLLPNSFAVVGFCRILKANERRLHRINDHLTRQFYSEYTLSLKLQLKENIWSIRSAETRTLLEIFVAVGNLMMSTGGPVIGIGMCVINGRARECLLPTCIYRRFFRPKNNPAVYEVELEERRSSIDEYFEILLALWDEAIEKSSAANK